jgi:hypothetical protein
VVESLYVWRVYFLSQQTRAAGIQVGTTEARRPHTRRGRVKASSWRLAATRIYIYDRALSLGPPPLFPPRTRAGFASFVAVCPFPFSTDRGVVRARETPWPLFFLEGGGDPRQAPSVPCLTEHGSDDRGGALQVNPVLNSKR